MKLIASAFVAAAALFTCAPAQAECRYGNHIVKLGPDEPVKLRLTASGYRNPEVAWQRLADQLSILGNVLVDLEARVVLNVRVDFFTEVVEYPFHVDKLCGETFEEMADRVAGSAGSMQQTGGNGGGYIFVNIVWDEELWSFSCTREGAPISCEGF